MTSRYEDRIIATNRSEMYTEIFRKRGVSLINQYSTPILRHPTSEEISDLDTIPHIWSAGDRFYKLAHEHYENSEMWWVIAWFNEVPTESHVSIGDILIIPFPLNKVLNFMDV